MDSRKCRKCDSSELFDKAQSKLNIFEESSMIDPGDLAGCMGFTDEKASKLCEEYAIDQIRKREYPARLDKYEGKPILVGIRYDRKTKKHECKIETA